jgi:predicted nucleotidyltransferase
MNKPPPTKKELEELLRPPTEAEVEVALARFAAEARRRYDDRLKGLYLFGSRARGDHEPESDADVAVVLADDAWRYWEEKMALADLSYDLLIDTGVEVQGWPVRESAWRNPEAHRNPSLVRAMRRDGRKLQELV